MRSSDCGMQTLQIECGNEDIAERRHKMRIIVSFSYLLPSFLTFTSSPSSETKRRSLNDKRLILGCVPNASDAWYRPRYLVPVGLHCHLSSVDGIFLWSTFEATRMQDFLDNSDFPFRIKSERNVRGFVTRSHFKASSSRDGNDFRHGRLPTDFLTALVLLPS